MQGNDRTSRQLRLRDGRRLGYAEYGDLDGFPVFFFAGLNNARFIRHPDDSIITDLHIRLITMDRPGIGLSDFQPGRTLLDWPDDVDQLADALGLGRFGVVGASMGGPYAIACAYRLPERLTAATVVSSAAPVSVPELFAVLPGAIKLQVLLSLLAPRVLGGMNGAMRGVLRRNPERVLRVLLKNLPERDQAIIAMPGNLPLLAEDMQECFRQGGFGSAYDLGVVSRPWGIPLGDIRARVFLWQGEDDPNVPPRMGRYLAESIPDCRASFVPGAGHLLIFSHWRDVMEQAVAEQAKLA